MNTPREEDIWKTLLAQSAPTFAGEDAPPFGLATRVLAAVQGAELQEALWERVGRRAIYAALGTVALIALITFARVQSHEETDLSMLGSPQAENVLVS